MAFEKLNAKSVMSRNVITIHLDTSLQEALETLADERITGAPVVDESGKPVGVVSQTDIVHYEVNKAPAKTGRTAFYSMSESEELPDVKDLEEQGELEEILAGVPVSRVMTPKVLWVKPDSTLPEVAAVMAKERVHRVLVVEKGKIVGLVSSLDILKALGKAVQAPVKVK